MSERVLCCKNWCLSYIESDKDIIQVTVKKDDKIILLAKKDLGDIVYVIENITIRRTGVNGEFPFFLTGQLLSDLSTNDIMDIIFYILDHVRIELVLMKDRINEIMDGPLTEFLNKLS